jgi:glycyl-tRNA synthetase beta chain
LGQYLKELDALGVIACPKKRKNLIAEQIKQICAKQGLEPVLDEELLTEVTALVEWPKVLLGKIEQRFMSLPQELLTSSMHQHQKYFTTTKNGQMASYFLFVCNLDLSNYSKIIADNEQVLQARLSDGLHFYEQDLKTPLIAKLELLRNMVFHSKLGSLADKSWRIEQICRYLAPDNNDLHLAAQLCKCDLASLVVGEFCQLQGVISGYYALADGLGPNVASIIAQHYKPVSINDEMPQGDSAILSFADKLDSLVCLMLAGQRATSSKDPYALRRQAACVLRIVLQLGLDIDLDRTCQFIASMLPDDLNNEQGLQEISYFILERLRHHLSKTYGEQIGNCIMPNNLANITKTQQIADSLTQLMQKPLWAELLSCYKRLCNIGSNCVKNRQVIVNEELLVSQYEKDLFQHYQQIVAQIAKNSSQEEKIALISTLTPLIAAFFDNVLVNTPELELAQNRANLVLGLKNCFDQTLNFASFL